MKFNWFGVAEENVANDSLYVFTMKTQIPRIEALKRLKARTFELDKKK